MDEGETSSQIEPKDPTRIARKYQLDLCKKAIEENIIVYLGTGCGKTHIAVLLMYELRHLIRKPSKEICVFLAPTIPLVRQQAMVIENSTDFKVRCYHGNQKSLRDHSDWHVEIEQFEVLVMTPQIFLHNLRHCFLKMELIALLIFDECHHAQSDKRHPYSQIMKEFYEKGDVKRPRIFGMTASPIVGKGGSNQLNYTKCINSLEQLLDAKVCSVDDNVELESVVASPEIEFFLYGPVNHSASSLIATYCKKLEALKQQCMNLSGGNLLDMKDYQKKMKSLWKLHENLIFCLQNIGLFGALQAAKILLAADGLELAEPETDTYTGENCFRDQYLSKAVSILTHNLFDDEKSADSFTPETFEEPFFSAKLLVLIEVLSRYRIQENMKCIIFVKRIILARSLAYILSKLECLNFWRSEFLVGCHSGSKNMSRTKMNSIVERFCSGEVNLLVATSVAEEGLDIQTCCLVVRFDLPDTVASFIQSRGRARMLKSKYVFLLERENQHDEKLIADFVAGENMMNKEIGSRSSDETFNFLEETVYTVDSTGASISTGYSISLLHRYCGNLPRDKYFTPTPNYFYIEDSDGGIICKIILPPNAALRQVEGTPCQSQDLAKRSACLKACKLLHQLGALTDYLLPGTASTGSTKTGSGSPLFNSTNNNEDENLREELHEMLVPKILKAPSPSNLNNNNNNNNDLIMYFYYIRFVPIPDDRDYRMFGLFLMNPLPKEAKGLELDLHLTHGRIVKTGLKPFGFLSFNKEEMMLARSFQQMFLKAILDRSELTSDFVPLDESNNNICSPSSTFYLLLPVKQQNYGDKTMLVDWAAIRRCLSSPVFGNARSFYWRDSFANFDSLRVKNGIFSKHDLVGSLVFTPHNGIFFFVDDVLEFNATCRYKGSSYVDYFKEKFDISLSYPEQPLLKAKQLYNLRNLLRNRLQDNTEAREQAEHFVELPPEICCLKILGFSKDMGSSVSLLPSLMHRLENLLVAIELKDLMISSFPEASLIRADCILEALTTEKCLERMSLERFEVLGDAFLKYAVGRHCFVSYEGLDEGQLTRKRSSAVNNLNLYELAVKKNLQAYIRDQPFDPAQFFALGRPCKLICNKETESTIHWRKSNSDSISVSVSEEPDSSNSRCSCLHHWLHKKTIADVVEALVGAFLVESGFNSALAFLRWIGIGIDFEIENVLRACEASNSNLSLVDSVNFEELERIIGHKFKFKGLLLQALIHPSYNKHSGGCYQKLEFLGDAVLEYLITSYLYSVYPDLKPGQITDLRSITGNNISFAHVAVWKTLHKYLIKDSNSLNIAINRFGKYVQLSDHEKDLTEEPACPKVLGDIVESCIGAVLLDTGFDLTLVWKLMLSLLDRLLSYSDMHINPVRELRELCQSSGFELRLPDPVKVKQGNVYNVTVEVGIKGEVITCTATNQNSKAARKIAAQETLSKLKAQGYKHKNKSLEEILRTTRKREAKLIGFDEPPLVIENNPCVEVSKLSIKEEREDKNKEKNGFVLLKRDPGPKVEWKEIPLIHDDGPSAGGTTHKTARTCLFEICAANYWNPPVFECCKDEGPSHLRMFTYKVTIQIRGATSIYLECFGNPKSHKKGAQEEAANGALWYLKHLGFTPKP